MSGQFEDFLSALYTLFLDERTDPEWCKRRYYSYENHEIYAVTTTVEWDNEGRVMQIEMTRTYATDTDKDVLLKATTDYGETYKIFHLNFKDLCYAVAKACTEVLKEYGFFGYRYSTENDWFKMHQLLFIKGYALNNNEACELIPTNEKSWYYKTDFEKEMELFLFDM